MWMEEMMAGFEERMRNIAVFVPLIELKNKKTYPYSMVELGIAVMLFILEDMLLQEKRSTYHHIAEFLRTLISSKYKDDLSYEEALDLTYHLVRDGLMNGGRLHTFSYFDFVSGREKTYKFHLVKIHDYEVNDRYVRLILSPQGKDLLFKTKEIYNEFQVSISQIYLRAQIKKGVFQGALRSVEELSLAVKSEKEKIRDLKERIIRDVLEIAREKELEDRLKHINEQLVREKEVFSELKSLVEYTMNLYREGQLGKKEDDAIQKIMKVRKRLLDIISEHESLLTDKIQIQRLMNESIENMILNTFSTWINFETEILGKILKGKEIHFQKDILDPIFSPRISSSFHPGMVFQEQTLKRKKREEEESLFPFDEEIFREREEEEKRLRKKKEKNLKEFLHLILDPLTQKDQTSIKSILSSLEEEEEDAFHEFMAKMDFYPFLVRLHQLGPIPILSREEVQGFFLDELPWLLLQVQEENHAISSLKSFHLLATDEIITLPNGYVISNFQVIGVKKDGL